MNITVIGASAGIGLETVKRALYLKHAVTGFSRSTVQLIGYENFESIRGDALNKPRVKKVIKNADAVLIALGADRRLRSTTLYSGFAKVLVEIQAETKTKIPFIFVTGFGTGNSQEYLSSWYEKMFVKYTFRSLYIDKAKMEEIISSSEMNWIIVRPGQLLDGPITEKYRIETELFSGMNIGEINRSDVADFMIKQAENPTELKKFVAISAK